MFKLTIEQSNAPKPLPPNLWSPQWKWDYYFSDLACWKAMQAGQYLSGVDDGVSGERTWVVIER